MKLFGKNYSPLETALLAVAALLVGPYVLRFLKNRLAKFFMGGLDLKQTAVANQVQKVIKENPGVFQTVHGQEATQQQLHTDAQQIYHFFGLDRNPFDPRTWVEYEEEALQLIEKYNPQAVKLLDAEYTVISGFPLWTHVREYCNTDQQNRVKWLFQ